MDEGGLLGLTQQLSTLGREMISNAGSSTGSPSNNPFGLSTPSGNSPQPIYSVPHNSPANGVVHISPARRSLFNSVVRKIVRVSSSEGRFLRILKDLEKILTEFLSFLETFRKDPQRS